jgi:hypothetical protein
VPHLYGYHLQLITHELKYRDAAGNESPPKVLTAQLVDSFAPAAPGDMFIRIIGEVGEDGEAGPVGPQDGDLGGTSGPSDDSSPTVEDVPSPPSGIEPAPEPSGPRDLVI